MRFCSKCGERVEAEDKFCSICGTPIKESKIVTGASDMTPEEKAQFRQIIEEQRSNSGKSMPVRKQTVKNESSADDFASIPPEFTGQERAGMDGQQRKDHQENPFEKRFEKGYYSTPVTPVQPVKKKGFSKLILLIALLCAMMVTTLVAMAVLFDDDDDEVVTPPETKAVVESRSEDDTSSETYAAGGESKTPVNNSLANLGVVRETFEPGLAEIGFEIDDSHTSIDDTSAYYFMWDDDDSAFVISFVNDGERFDDFQMYSCSWDMELRMLSLCEKKLGVTFDSKDLEQMKAEAEKNSNEASDHYGFSDYVYAGDYMCSLMVSPYSDDETRIEYSLFLEQRYTETASR